MTKTQAHRLIRKGIDSPGERTQEEWDQLCRLAHQFPDYRKNWRDNIVPPGTRVYFEYHCWESPESADAELWYRSHQRVTVLECDNPASYVPGQCFAYRGQIAAVPLTYRVRFQDGHEADACEDELCKSLKEYCRPDPSTVSGEPQMDQYLVNCDYNAGRKADYATRDYLVNVWFPCTGPPRETYGGRLEMMMYFRDRKVIFGKWPLPPDKTRFYHVIPSALLLYRLACTFPLNVQVNGPQGDKEVWEIWLRHREGDHIGFHDWKGRPGIYNVERPFSHLLDDLQPQAKRDLKCLINYLVSDTCGHPYGKLVAGGVA